MRTKIRPMLFIFLAIFFGWYSQQAANNPWRMRSSYFFTDSSVVFYEQNHNSRSYDFVVNIPLSDSMHDFDFFDIYGWIFRNRGWGISAESGDTLIVFPFEESEHDLSRVQILADVLVISGDSARVAENRRIFRPRKTIWFSDEKYFEAANVFIPQKGENFQLLRRRRGLAVSAID